MTDVDDESPQFALLTKVAFALAAVLATARGMTLLYLRDVLPVLPLAPGELAPAAAAGPSTQMWLDALSFIPALLVLLRWGIDRSYHLSRAGSAIALLLLAGWAFATTLWADDAFAAGVSASAWLAVAALFFTFANTVRAWRDVRLTTALAAGLLLVNVVAGLYFVFIEHPTLVEDVRANQATLLAERNIEPGSFKAEQFLGRIMRGEFAGFAASSNSYASTLVMLSFALIGVAVARLRGERERAWGWILLIGLLPAFYLLWRTQSRTAIAAAVLAGGGLIVLRAAGSWAARHRNLTLSAVAVAALLGAGLIVGLGLTETLPHVSLRFRWNYWLGAVGVFGESPLTGVGFANFGDAYLAHRPAASAEEVKDPHNLLIRFFSETGLIGGLLAISWLAWLAFDVTRPATPGSRGNSPVSLKAASGIAIAAVALATFASIDFASQPAYVAIEVMQRLAYGLVMLIIVILAVARDRQASAVTEEPAPFILAAVVAGGAAVVVHSMLDVVLFEPSVLAAFALMIGPVVGVGRIPARETLGSRPVRLGIVAIATLAAGAWLVGFAVPIVLAESSAATADARIRAGQLEPAVASFLEAEERAPVGNADYLERAARAAGLAGDAAAGERFSLAALEVNPRRIQPRLVLADIAEVRGDDEAAVRWLGEVVSLNPNEMSLRRRYADALARLGERDAAAEQLRAVLAIHEQLAADEPERLDPEELTEIEARLEALSSSAAPAG